MGLASKLAASQGVGGYPPQPPGGAPSGQKPAAYPGQGQYQAYPGATGQPGQYPPQQPSGYPPQQQGNYRPQQPGGYPPQNAQQYGAPPGQQGAPRDVGAYMQILQSCIQEKRLQNMFPPNDPGTNAKLNQYAQRASTQVDQFCAKWQVPHEVGKDIAKLALFDIILYIDDSGSMKFYEGGERIRDLKLIVSRVAYAASLFDDDGIKVRFMNSTFAGQEHMLNNLRSEEQVEQLIAMVPFQKATPMGQELMAKILRPEVLEKARANQLPKPVLIITITDGEPSVEPPGMNVFEVIHLACAEMSRTRYGQGALSFQFAQVGNDEQAMKFLGKLDKDPTVGQFVDCTSNYEQESLEMSQKTGVDLSVDLWLMKLLLGAIDRSYDTEDEAGGAGNRPPSGPSYGSAPQGQYGAPQPPPSNAPGGYGQQQGGYPPPPQQYGRPPPQPPYGQAPPAQNYGRPQQPGGYPPQQGGYPPQQSGYPPQPGYPPQQGGYGQPPLPPRY